jgi:hypothetical protein
MDECAEETMTLAAPKKQKSALKSEDPWQVGYAHLQETYALIQGSPDGEDFQEKAKNALSKADLAIEVFSSIPYPGGTASAHLARASIYTQLADAEEDPLKKAGGVDRALTSCLAAQEALNAEGVQHGQLFDVYSSVSLLLLRLREMIKDDDYQEGLDQLIKANSTLLGEVVAEDIKLRGEGDSLLFTAHMVGALAEIEEDEEQKKDFLITKSFLALQAGHWLETISDPDLIVQALETYQAAWDQIEGENKSSQELRTDPLNCPRCGTMYSPGSIFCSECGASLKEGK